jgi:hypothetical protein
LQWRGICSRADGRGCFSSATRDRASSPGFGRHYGSLTTARIVHYVHRPRRPPPKQKASALARAEKVATKVLPVTVTATSEKRLKRLRAERTQQSAAEPGPELKAFFARNVRPGGPLPPER